MDPVVEDAEVGVGRAATGAEDEGDVGIVGGHTTDGFLVAEGVAEDDVGLLELGDLARARVPCHRCSRCRRRRCSRCCRHPASVSAAWMTPSQGSSICVAYAPKTLRGSSWAMTADALAVRVRASSGGNREHGATDAHPIEPPGGGGGHARVGDVLPLTLIVSGATLGRSSAHAVSVWTRVPS